MDKRFKDKVAVVTGGAHGIALVSKLALSRQDLA